MIFWQAKTSASAIWRVAKVLAFCNQMSEISTFVSANQSMFGQW